METVNTEAIAEQPGLSKQHVNFQCSFDGFYPNEMPTKCTSGAINMENIQHWWIALRFKVWLWSQKFICLCVCMCVCVCVLETHPYLINKI